MKIGDMVVRAYAFRAFIPGIIIDEQIEILKEISEKNEEYEYEDHHFIVQWSDGTQSREMDMELDYLEDAIRDHQEYLKTQK
mgnify:CR=1 FL=1|tara:strand:+ start:775 stop:1020 length:246 start_codon:yes stop_codon:yes gene_type:complete